jgi:hypothetical protein
MKKKLEITLFLFASLVILSTNGLFAEYIFKSLILANLSPIEANVIAILSGIGGVILSSYFFLNFLIKIKHTKRDKTNGKHSK